DVLRRAGWVAMIVACVVASVLGGCANSGMHAESGSGGAGISLEGALATITPAEMYERIAWLASDENAGRDTPSPGLERAAAYLADEFASFGLAPKGDDGTFLQRYPLPLRALDTTAVHFGTVVSGENRMLSYGIDYFVAPAPPYPDAAMGHGAIIYVGVISDSALPPGAAVKGQVMAVSLPGGYDRAWRLASTRARAASQEAGASALVVLLAPEFPAAAIGQFARQAAQPSRGLVDPDEIPVFFLTRTAAAAVFARAGVDVATLPAAPAERVMLAGVDAHFAAPAAVLEADQPPNVVALLRGSDPQLRDTYVVFSAHMDHVGIGTADATGDSIYNGADDDASGTAALVEVAQAFAALSEPPARSLLFLAVSGEEKGLLGSRWFSDHPTVPVESIVANINVDMIGRNAPDSIVVIGQEYSSLGPLVLHVAADHPALGLTVSHDLWPEEQFFFRSDHFNFARLEIPALFFFAGVHEDYHRPSDEVEKIDADKAARVARLIFHTAYAIAAAAEPPSWTPEGLAQIRALTR
ncbi:MAG: M28 family peptidase, partial [Gemmatimonadota bacterium]